MLKVAIHQSQYIPWPPYFKKIASADVFVLLDNVQYQKNGVQNRNSIRNKSGEFLLTIPVTGHLEDLISEKKISDPKWNDKHWKSIYMSYVKAPRWNDFSAELESEYKKKHLSLGAVNESFLSLFIKKLGITTKIIKQSELKPEGSKSDLVLDICNKLGASVYISGMGSKGYLDEGSFERSGIKIDYVESIAPRYQQFHGSFIQGLSMLDMMLNLNESDMRKYLYGE